MVEELIATILKDIKQKGYSSIKPFSIGKIELRMMQFAQANEIVMGSDEIYISAKQIQHCMRASKGAKGLVISEAELIEFPQNRYQMSFTTTDSVLSMPTKRRNSSFTPTTK